LKAKKKAEEEAKKKREKEKRDKEAQEKGEVSMEESFLQVLYPSPRYLFILAYILFVLLHLRTP
jgi:hypothetical protein